MEKGISFGVVTGLCLARGKGLVGRMGREGGEGAEMSDVKRSSSIYLRHHNFKHSEDEREMASNISISRPTLRTDSIATHRQLVRVRSHHRRHAMPK